jgi:Amt family ammonium transporter
VNAAGANGLFYGNASLLGKQAIAVAVSIAYSFIVTSIILKVLDWTMGLRVDADDESEGLDQSQHGESGYIFE